MIADSRVPNGVGILPLRHDGHVEQGYSTDMRSSLVAVRITGRDDTGEGLGHWFYDPDAVGTLENANFWDVDRAARTVPGWAFAWSATLEGGGGGGNSNDVATPSARSAPRSSGRQTAARPNGAGGESDGRYNRKPVIIPQKFGKAGGDPARPPQPPPGAAGPGGNVLHLGIGAQVWSLSSSFASFSFGGSSSLGALSGIAGVGRGSGFARFSVGGRSTPEALSGIGGVGFGSRVQFQGVRQFIR